MTLKLKKNDILIVAITFYLLSNTILATGSFACNTLATNNPQYELNCSQPLSKNADTIFYKGKFIGRYSIIMETQHEIDIKAYQRLNVNFPLFMTMDETKKTFFFAMILNESIIVDKDETTNIKTPLFTVLHHFVLNLKNLAESGLYLKDTSGFTFAYNFAKKRFLFTELDAFTNTQTTHSAIGVKNLISKIIEAVPKHNNNAFLSKFSLEASYYINLINKALKDSTDNAADLDKLLKLIEEAEKEIGESKRSNNRTETSNLLIQNDIDQSTVDKAKIIITPDVGADKRVSNTNIHNLNAPKSEKTLGVDIVNQDPKLSSKTAFNSFDTNHRQNISITDVTYLENINEQPKSKKLSELPKTNNTGRSVIVIYIIFGIILLLLGGIIYVNRNNKTNDPVINNNVTLVVD